MQFDTKIAIVIAQDLLVWQKLNVVAFMTSGILSETEENIIGEAIAKQNQSAAPSK